MITKNATGLSAIPDDAEIINRENTDAAVHARLAGLPPEKRALFILKIRERIDGAAQPSIISRQAASDQAPLSFAQQRLYFLHSYEPENPSYNMPSALRLRGILSFRALEKSIGEIIRRHESLRTTFSVADGEPVQVIFPPGNFQLQQTDLSGLAQEEAERQARRMAGAAAQTIFDLQRGPLYRIHLVRLDDRDHILLLTISHIIADGSSISVLIDELAALYGAYLSNKPSPLPALPIQYSDFARWQRANLGGERLERSLEYWRTKLDGAPELLDLPADHPRPAVKTYRGDSLAVEIPADLLRSLRRLGREAQVTLYVTLLTVFKILLYRLSGQCDLVVGSALRGRDNPQTEGLIGFFINTLALRTDLSGNPSVRNALSRVQDVVLESFEHQEVPFEKVVRMLKSDRDSGQSPLFQVMFSLQALQNRPVEFAGLRLGSFDYEFGSSKFDLSFILFDSDETVSGFIEYNRDLFETETVSRMLDYYLKLLAEAAARPRLPILQLDIHARRSSDPARVSADAGELFNFSATADDRL